MFGDEIEGVRIIIESQAGRHSNEDIKMSSAPNFRASGGHISDVVVSEFRQHYVRNYTFPSHSLATSGYPGGYHVVPDRYYKVSTFFRVLWYYGGYCGSTRGYYGVDGYYGYCGTMEGTTVVPTGTTVL